MGYPHVRLAILATCSRLFFSQFERKTGGHSFLTEMKNEDLTPCSPQKQQIQCNLYSCMFPPDFFKPNGLMGDAQRRHLKPDVRIYDPVFDLIGPPGPSSTMFISRASASILYQGNLPSLIQSKANCRHVNPIP